MSASGAADVSPFKALQWSLEEKFNIGDRVCILLSLPEEPSSEVLERFSSKLGLPLQLRWKAPILEITLKRPPRSADLASALEKAVTELEMLPMRVGYR